MSYQGDYTEDYATLNFKFTTRTTTGAPTTLAGTPVISVYKANGTTESVAGVTLTVDFDAVTGLNNVLIDLSADAFYAIANDYQVVITTGTVGGVSVVGEVVGAFSIENRFDEVDVTKLGGDAQSLTDLKDFADAGYDPVTNKVQGVVLTDTASTLTNKTGFSLAATGLDAIVSTATGMVEIAKAVWDRILSKANHNIGQSAGKIVRKIGDLIQIDGAVTGTPTKTTFDTNLTQIDTYFDDAILIFSNGAANSGIGQPVSAYLNANGNMTFLAPDDWPVTPIVGDDFVIYATHVHTIAQIQNGLATEAKQDDIKAKTDDMTYTKANELDINIQSVNDVTVTGDGSSGNTWGP